MSLLSSSKCVLLISDDSLYVYKAGPKTVELVKSFNWNQIDFEDSLAHTLNAQVRDGLIYVLNDAVEQHYRKEKINKITFFEKNAIVSRRLNIAFPSYPTRAALSLKEKKKGLQLKAQPEQENLFLFAAAPSTEAFRKMLEAVRRSDVIIKEFCLLPVESVDLVDKIALKLSKENRSGKKAVWSVLLGQHQGGGLRQIVTKGGQIALTRTTPVIPPDAENGAEWASDVVQEIQSTISYLSRFGYTPEDGLDIILISKPELGTLVEDLINIPCQFSSLNLQRAAEYGGVHVGRHQDQHYADPLHVAWFTKKPFHVMPMASKEISAVSKPRSMALVGMFFLTACFAFFAYNMAMEATKLHANKANLVEVTAMRQTAERMYDEEIQRKETLGIDVKLLQGSLAVFQDLTRKGFDPLPVLETVGKELKDLRIQKMELKTEDLGSMMQDNGSYSGDQLNPPPPMPRAAEMLFTFHFPGTIRPQDGNASIYQLRDRLARSLKGYQVVVSKKLADLSYTGEYQNETGVTAALRKPEDIYTGEILIRREADDATDTGAE